METNENTVADLQKLHETLDVASEVLGKMPKGIYYTFAPDGPLHFQAYSQARVRKIRVCFTSPKPVWRKAYSKECQWWEYTTEWRGLPVKIYAVHEAPPTCTAIIVKRTVIEKVPVAFEEREVVKETLVWDCGPEGEAGNADTAEEE